MSRIKAVATAGSALGAATALALVSSASGQVQAQAPGCTPKTNVEAIIDDSGSMSGTDPGDLRKDALIAIIRETRYNDVTLGAVEFGTNANPVFPPAKIGAARAGMEAALNALVQSDNGGTDYNDGFGLAAAQNPAADARIFLTDGGHNEGAYLNAHLPGPPTYVIGFSSITDPADNARLQQIANDTKGKYYPPVVNPSDLIPTLNDVESDLFCARKPVRFVDTFTAAGQTKGHTTRLSRSTRTVNFRISWATAGDSFDVTRLVIRSRGETVAKSSRARKLRIKRSAGPTFLNVTVRGARPGTLKFRVKAKRIATPGVPQQVTTQLRQSRSR